MGWDQPRVRKAADLAWRPPQKKRSIDDVEIRMLVDEGL